MLTKSDIAKCFGKQYCLIKDKECLGKDVSKDMLLLKKLYIAYWVYCNDENDCDVSCFISQHCNTC